MFLLSKPFNRDPHIFPTRCFLFPAFGLPFPSYYSFPLLSANILVPSFQQIINTRPNSIFEFLPVLYGTRRACGGKTQFCLVTQARIWLLANIWFSHQTCWVYIYLNSLFLPSLSCSACGETSRLRAVNDDENLFDGALWNGEGCDGCLIWLFLLFSFLSPPFFSFLWSFQVYSGYRWYLYD